MKLMKWVPKPLRRFIRERMTIYVYTYGFRPSAAIQEQALTFTVGGRAFTVRADHRTALYDMIAEIVDYDAYQLSQITWRANGTRHIVDIGANIGVTALAFSQIPGASVTCYEPDPENCKLLQENVESNKVTNVRIFQAAVAKKNGTIEFHTDEESTGGRIADEQFTSKRPKIAVPATTLANAVARCESSTIELLKCDCEGGEYDIVDQITPELAGRIRNISMEVHDLDQRRNVQTVSDQLSRLGYRLSCKPDMWERSALHLLLATQNRH